MIHGDLHPGNILSCGEGKYRVIEPVGVIGDPVFDIGNIIFGECCWFTRGIAEPETAEKIIDYFEKSLNIPNKTLRQIFYLTTVMSRVWNLDRIKFAESVMNKVK